MSLKVIKAGIYAALQDGGRRGYRHWGINPGGVMDAMASNIANSILGNDLNDPVLELQFPTPVFECINNIIITITGANFDAHVNDNSIALNTPVLLRGGDILYFQKPQNNRIAYMATQNGFVADEWLQSSSTNIKLGIGGYNGRVLKKDDIIKNKKPAILKDTVKNDSSYIFPWRVNYEPDTDNTILLLPGKDWHRLNQESKNIFLQSTYTISSQSDRMGFYLSGEALYLQEPSEMVSFGVNFGTMQLLPGGQLVVLMADHQTTGGYPCIANVIATHRGKLSQKMGNAALQFAFTNIEEAQQLLTRQKSFLKQVQSSCITKWKQYND